MVANGGGMKTWLCSHFQFTTSTVSQFFIFRVSKSTFNYKQFNTN